MTAYPVVTGAVLIEANGAALNNAGVDETRRVEQTILVKQIHIGRLRFPYVSGQAWRRWWREVLYSDFGWTPSPITVIKQPQQQAFTACDPIQFKEDDLFGYMMAVKRTKESGTYRRISPLKNSLLISVLPNTITMETGHLTRHQQDIEKRLSSNSQGYDPLIYQAEHYSTYLQGVFTISLTDVGRFMVGEMYDIPKELVSSHTDQLEPESDNGRVYLLPHKERVKRVQQVLQALARLRGGARLARNLSDVTPVVVLIGFLDGGNAPFQRLFEPDANNERVLLNLDRLRSVLNDYADRVLKPRDDAKALYFGYRPTVLANEAQVLQALKDEEPFKKYIEVVGTPRQALEKAAEAVAPVFDRYLS